MGKTVLRIFGLLWLAVTIDVNSVTAEDTVEFLTGATLTGKVLQIDKANKTFEFETTVADRAIYRTFPFAKVHAVTMGGKRYVLTAKKEPTDDDFDNEGNPPVRSKSEVQAIIAEAGTTLPDWLESTQLDYPETLDLSWPLGSPNDGWKSHKYMSHYLWTVVNENPSRWRSGIKLVHHCMTLHQGDTARLDRDMEMLGAMYFTLLQDYARAAYWLQKSSVSVTGINGIRLAECYWRLGNKEEALDMMRGKRLAIDAIKLLGDMGEIESALEVANAYERSSVASQALLLAGDALRQAGRTDEAIEYYEKAVTGQEFRDEEYAARFRARARDSIEAIRLYDQFDISRVADGSYSAESIGYSGRVEVRVDVSSGRIEDVQVTQQKEKRHYTALTDIPNQIVSTQSILEIDGTSGATITSQAIINASAKALAGDAH